MNKQTALLALIGALGLALAAQAQPVRAPAAASAASAARGNSSATHMRKVQAACKKKVNDRGLAGDEAKKAMFDCMHNP
jgi:hypothetical protein